MASVLLFISTSVESHKVTWFLGNRYSLWIMIVTCFLGNRSIRLKADYEWPNDRISDTCERGKIALLHANCNSPEQNGLPLQTKCRTFRSDKHTSLTWRIEPEDCHTLYCHTDHSPICQPYMPLSVTILIWIQAHFQHRTSVHRT